MRGMTDLWTSAEIAAATGGQASAPFVVSGVAFDSRAVGSGDLFIALSGEATDGHRFVWPAFAAGAAGAIVGRAGDNPHVLGGDTTANPPATAAAERDRPPPRILGVTGSDDNRKHSMT